MRTISPQVGQSGSDESPIRLNGFGLKVVCPHVGKISTECRAKRFETTGWIDKISHAWALGPANTLVLARLLHQARQSMKHGQWSRIWRSPRLPFSKRKAEMLVTVGEVLGGLNAKNSAYLPTAWNTLYYIAQLGQTLTEQLIAKGQIHPRELLREARKLVAEHRPGRVCKGRTPSTLKRRLDRFSNFVLARAANWSLVECQLVHVELKRIQKVVAPESIKFCEQNPN
jgi:hypothetical protein